MNLQGVNKFHKTRLGYLVFGLVELGLAYIFALWALDSGNLLEWLLALILFVGFLQNIARMAVHKK